MADLPTLDRYCAGDREELLDLFRTVLGPEVSARAITQFPWKYETNPCRPAQAVRA